MTRAVINKVSEIKNRKIDYLDVYDLCKKYVFIIEHCGYTFDTKKFNTFKLYTTNNVSADCELLIGTSADNYIRLSKIDPKTTKIRPVLSYRNFLQRPETILQEMGQGSRESIN